MQSALGGHTGLRALSSFAQRIELVSVLILSMFVLNLGTGCSTLQAAKDYPSRTEAWCYAKMKWKRAKKEVYAGISCYY